VKTFAVLFLSMAALSCAEDQRTPEKKRLESVTWDLKSHRLVWVVQKGNEPKEGDFQVKSTERYEIAPDEAVMMFSQEKRGFTKDEAKALHRLLDTLSQYCAESVVWWDRGEGERLDKEGNSMRVEQNPKPERKPRKERRAAPAGDTAPLQIARVLDLLEAHAVRK
jgi:hypothetical protein